jgi:hypothetical protein
MSNSQKRKRVQDEASDHETEIKQTKSNNPNLFSQHLNKAQLVNKVLNFAKNHVTIKQRTPKWRELMKATIGGSEIGTLFGYSWRGQPRLDMRKLIEKKRANADIYVPTVPCIWGNLFEDVIRAYTEIVFETEIYGSDICIINGKFRYSPDGLGVVIRVKEGIQIVLYEFKCPYSRIPDGTIPKHYKAQVWAGLAATEEITRYGIFAEAIFRKCRLTQLGDTPYFDKRYHSKDKQVYKKPLAWGVFNIYSSEVNHGKEYVDYGNAHKDVFDKMLADVQKGTLVASLQYLEFSDSSLDTITYEQGGYDAMHIVGYIPFKLMWVYFKRVDPIPGFKTRVINKIDEFFKVVNKE